MSTQPENAKTATSKRLRIRYGLALGAIAVLVLLSQLIVHWCISRFEQDTHIVNIAGRQRMLSQEITKLALIAAHPDAGFDQAGPSDLLSEARDSFSKAQEALQFGNVDMGIPPCENTDILKMFTDITPHYAGILAGSKRILKSTTIKPNAGSSSDQTQELRAAIIQIRRHEKPFLKEMDRIVFVMDAAARSKVAVLQNTEVGLVAGILILILLTALLLFEPAVRLLDRQFDDINTKTADLKNALAFVKQLTGMLPICASCKKIRGDEGDWSPMEVYIERHSEAIFSHGVCPDCEQELYPRASRQKLKGVKPH